MKKPSLNFVGLAHLSPPKRKVQTMAAIHKLLERIRKFRGRLPQGFKFDRHDTNKRSR
jgi:hypothetical protein